MEKMRVFVVVEDEPDMRVLVRLKLTVDPRITVAGEVGSLEEALELAQSIKPGLIILDHQIEGDVMGLDAAPLLKDAAPNAKILLFTAFDLETEATSSPFIDEFLSKKHLENLLAVAQRLLGLEPL